MNFAELEVFNADGQNVALAGTATQSSQYDCTEAVFWGQWRLLSRSERQLAGACGSVGADKAIDGSLNTYQANDQTKTNPWWSLRISSSASPLGIPSTDLSSIRLYPRPGSFGDRINGAVLTGRSSNGEVLFSTAFPAQTSTCFPFVMGMSASAPVLSSTATATASANSTSSSTSTSTISVTPSPSPSPTPTFTSAAVIAPCAAPPGQYCTNGGLALCSIGAFCAGGAGAPTPCSPATACTVVGLSAQPPCYWNVSTLAGSGTAGWADGQGTASMFYKPVGVFYDSVYSLIYVSDTFNHRLRRIFPNGLVDTLAGSGIAAFADGVGTAASFRWPYGMGSDPYGNLYVADSGNHCVRKILPSGLVTTLAGNGVLGGTNGVGTFAQFNIPHSIALDSSGSTGYVVEQNGCRIRRIIIANGDVSLLAGSGTCGFSDNVDGALAQFNEPSFSVWHPAGFLYVSGRRDNRIRRVNISSTAVTTFSGSGVADSVDGVGTNAAFNIVNGIALDSSHTMLYAPEEGGRRIRSVDLTTALVQTIAGNGAPASVDGFGVSSSFNSLLDMAVSPTGVLYTAENSANRIRQLTCVPCPASYYCSSGAPVLCPSGSYCPLSSINPIPCPSGYNSTSGQANCSISTLLTTPATVPPGSQCNSDASCASSACRGGHCCSSSAALLGCSTCSIQTGSCVLFSPGDMCASNFDCGTNLCLGGCCCASSAMLTPGCISCRCASVTGTTAATAGTCSQSAAIAAPRNVTLPCTSAVSVNSNVSLSSVIAFPSSANVTDATPLVFIPAASPLNSHGVDIIVASASACAAFAANRAANTCTSGVFVLSEGTFYYLGRASALGMTAAPSCSA